MSVRWLPLPSSFPWRRPRHEVLLLTLVAVATLSVVYPVGAQDVSRVCLSRAIARGRLSNDACFNRLGDSASFGGHLYSDKPPAISVVALPVVEAVGLAPPSRWGSQASWQLWLTRLATGGLALLLSAFLVGRIAEGLSPGWGGATLVTYATGTLVGGLAVDNFGEVPAAAVAFAAFALAWARRSGWAGLVAGLAVLVEYQALLIVCAIAAYIALCGRRAFLRYALGLVPGFALLALYDLAAFGSPFHLSYRYVSPQFSTDQAGGFFGVHVPAAHRLVQVLVGHRGIFVVAPVLVLAFAGLVLLWRGGARAEATLCLAMPVLFIVIDAGYFDPWGGDSDGARFVIPSLPFLMLGVSKAFARWRILTSALAAVSIVGSTLVLMTWPAAVNAAFSVRGWTIWRALAQLIVRGRASQLALWTQRTAIGWLGVDHLAAFALVLLAASAAFVIGLRDGLMSRRTT